MMSLIILSYDFYKKSRYFVHAHSSKIEGHCGQGGGEKQKKYIIMEWQKQRLTLKLMFAYKIIRQIKKEICATLHYISISFQMRKGKGVGKHHHSRKAGPFSSAMMIGSQINLFNRKQIIDKQNKLKKLYETTKDNPQTEFYENINYHYTIYQLGDFIELYSLDPTQSFVAKLTQIIKIPPDNDIKRQTKVFIEVERVLKKNELPQHLLDDYGDIISSGEIFPSQQKIYLYVGSIKRKVDILTIQVYGGICSTNDSMYYTRANFDCEKKVLDPDPQEWKKYCVCQRPYNPDLEFVACSKCDNWFHSECVEAKIINGHFMCDSCFGS